MDQTPARSRRASRCSFLDETPGKVAKPARQSVAMDVVKGKEDIGKLTGGKDGKGIWMGFKKFKKGWRDERPK